MSAQTPSFSLSASVRSVIGKQVRQLRREGIIPAVVYGHNKESRSISLNGREFLKTYKEAGSSSLIDLSIDGGTSEKVLVYDVQVYAPTNTALHVDFYTVNMKEKLQTEIELVFVGVAPAVEVEGGTLITLKDVLNVECLPQDLVSEIEVDISRLTTFGDTIHIKDVPMPSGMTLLDDPEDLLATVNAPRSEEEMAELDETPDTTLEVQSQTGNLPTPEDAKAV